MHRHGNRKLTTASLNSGRHTSSPAYRWNGAGGIIGSKPTSFWVHAQQYRHSSSKHPSLPLQFLDAYNGSKFDPSTHQRNDVPFDPIDGKPAPRSSSGGSKVVDASQSASSFSNNWIDSQEKRWRADSNDFDCNWSSLEDASTANPEIDASTRILWSNWTESLVRNPTKSPMLFEYSNLVSKDNNGDTKSCKDEEDRLLKVLHQYGLVLIQGTPTDTDTLPAEIRSDATKSTQTTGNNENESAESAISHLASIIGYHPLQTLYGSGVWSTSSQSTFYTEGDGSENDGETSASTADSAYGSTSLPLHTDMTYSTNPPGVQVFLMVQPATAPTASGGDDDEDSDGVIPKGQSVYLDGFAAAQQLFDEHPEAFHLLTNIPRTYRCIDDDEGWHLEATGPIIETASGDGIDLYGPVRSIRHNDLDRLPDLPPYPASDVEHLDIYNDIYYRKMNEVHEVWNDILRRDENRLVLELQPGDCVLVANQRVMHGRYAFETSKFPRVVMGCYVGLDELMSKWRKMGIHVV